VKVGGQTQQVQFSSSDPSVLEVNEKGGLTVKGPGKAMITVAVGEESVRFRYTLVALPIDYGMSQDEIIKTLGLPDKRTQTFVGAFEDDGLDGAGIPTGLNQNVRLRPSCSICSRRALSKINLRYRDAD
jgi:hypothetical protein